MTKTQINADTARATVDACVEFGKSTLAPNGDIVESHVMDGQLPIGTETAQLKAKTVDGRVIRLDLGKEHGLAYYFVGGGLPIVVEDQLIGAIGVGTQDEMSAYTALSKVLGSQPPLAPAASSAGGAPAGGRGQ